MATRTTRGGDVSLVQKAAGAVGIVFILVGVAGFIPGLTTNYDTMTFVDHESEAQLLGLFRVNILHNIVHLLFGVAALVAARAMNWSRSYLVGGGALYLVLFLYGLVVDLDEPANFVSLNGADNWLHLGLGVGMIALGILVPRARQHTRPATA